MRGLCAQGPRALGLLRQALAHPRTRQLAGLTKCVAVLEKEAGPPLPSAAPRLLGLRRPEGTLAALLAYLPYAEQGDMQEQIVELIGRLGWLEGKADPLLSKALQDPVGIRRATAAVLLLRQGNDQQKAEGRKLLHDSDAEVRCAWLRPWPATETRLPCPSTAVLAQQPQFRLGGRVECHGTNVSADSGKRTRWVQTMGSNSVSQFEPLYAPSAPLNPCNQSAS